MIENRLKMMLKIAKYIQIHYGVAFPTEECFLSNVITAKFKWHKILHK